MNRVPPDRKTPIYPTIEEIESVADDGSFDALHGADWLISTVGNSPATSLAACKAVRPKRLLLIPSPETQSMAEEIRTLAIKWAQTSSSARPYSLEVEVRSVAAKKPDDMADALLDLWVNGPLKDAKRVALDFTGGTKPMSGIALALSVLRPVDLVYLDLQGPPPSDRAYTGTETMRRMRGPEAFRKQVCARRLAAALRGGAFSIVETLADQEVPDPRDRGRGIDAMVALGRVLDRLASFRLEKAPSLSELARDLEEDVRHPDVSAIPINRDIVRWHVALARGLAANDRDRRHERLRPLLLMLLADFYHQSGRLEIAGLLFYRAAEAALAIRVVGSPQWPAGTTTSECAWDQLEAACPGVGERFDELGKAAFDEYEPKRPKKLDFSSLFRVAQAMEPARRVAGKHELKDACQRAAARNNSILAHGWEETTDAALNGIRDLAMAIIDEAGLPARWADDIDQPMVREWNSGRLLGRYSIRACIDEVAKLCHT